jgi:hypothetical protein
VLCVSLFVICLLYEVGVTVCIQVPTGASLPGMQVRNITKSECEDVGNDGLDWDLGISNTETMTNKINQMM